MELSEEVMKEIERISHERIQEINGNLDEALKYLTELKYPVAPKKFDPTGTINQYHEAKRQGAVFGIKIALTSPELLSKAGWVKKEEWIPIKDAEKFFNDFYGKYVTVLCPIYNRATKLMSWEMYHVEIDNNGDLFYADGSGDCGITYKDVDFYRLENFPPLPSPPENK